MTGAWGDDMADMDRELDREVSPKKTATQVKQEKDLAHGEALQSLKVWAENTKTMLRTKHGMNPYEANLMVNDVMYGWGYNLRRDRDFSQLQVRLRCHHIGGEDGTCDRCGARI